MKETKSCSSLPLVSIITVTYNSEDTLQRTINSVKNQTYEKIEYIVVDGNSCDETLDIIKKNEEYIDKWVSENDEGIYDAMNKGIQMADGDLVGILGSDDWYEKDAIEQVVCLFTNYKGADLIHGNIRVWENGENKTVWSNEGKICDYLGAPFNHPASFVKAEVYEDIDLYNCEYKTAADYDFMLRFRNSNYEDVAIDSVLVNFQQGGVSSGIPPFKQLWKILKNNGYSYPQIFIGLVYRLLKFSVSKMLGLTIYLHIL